MENERLIDNYNSLVPTMNKLVKEGFNIWEHHDILSGYGFKVIGKKKWIEVSIHHYFDMPNVFVVSCYEKNGNCLDIISNKMLSQNKTNDFKKVYDLIKGETL